MSARLRGVRVAVLVLMSLLLAPVGVLVGAQSASADPTAIEGTITTPAATAGIAVHLSRNLSSASGAPPQVTHTDAAGHFVFTGVAIGRYLIVVDAGDHWVQFSQEVELDGVTDPPIASIALRPGVAVSGTVRDAITRQPIAGISVTATGDEVVKDMLLFDPATGLAPTDRSGAYRLVLPLGDAYDLVAEDLGAGRYFAQPWDLLNGCACSQQLVVSPTGALSSPGWYLPAPSSFDFAMADNDKVIEVLASVAKSTGAAAAGVEVLLDKQVDGSWVPSARGITDASGQTLMVGAGTGDYRLRYRSKGTPLTATAATGPRGVTYRLAADGKQTLLSGLDETIWPEFYEPSITLAAPKPPTPKPPVSTPPVTQPAPPTPSGSPPPASPSLPTPTPTPDPAPESTSTPSPAPSPASPSPDAEPGPDDANSVPLPGVDAPSGGDAGWIWVLVLLGAVVVLVPWVALIRLHLARP